MPYYPTLNAAFIHIPKTGGASIMAALPDEREFFSRVTPELADLYQWGDRKLDFTGPRTMPPHRRQWMHHLSYSGLHKALGPVLGNAFTFAFVRNPWDRIVSLHHFNLNKLPPFDEWLNGRFAELQWPNQADYIYDAGVLQVDKVGRFESYVGDVSEIFGTLGIECKLPHLNKTDHGHYRQYYNAATRKAVADKYARDIEVFGYKF